VSPVSTSGFHVCPRFPHPNKPERKEAENQPGRRVSISLRPWKRQQSAIRLYTGKRRRTMPQTGICPYCKQTIPYGGSICCYCRKKLYWPRQYTQEQIHRNRIILSILAMTVLLGIPVLIMVNGSDSPPTPSGDMVVSNGSNSPPPASSEEWYSGGLSSSASMSEWTVASDRDQLATSADIATAALKLKYGSLHAAMQKLGTMESLRPYAIAVQSCMNTAVKRPPETTEESWRRVLQKQTVRDFGVGCLAELKVEGGVGF
jgi:hypothetical protein